MARVKIGTLSNPDTHLDKNSGNAIANNAVALALESLIPNYFASKSEEVFKRSTDKLIVKNKTFVDFPANVHVFSNGIFSGPDGLMMPTDKNATGGNNFNGIFFRQKNSAEEFVYSNKDMTAGSVNLPVYDSINDRYIISSGYGVFYGVPNGDIPNRTISWSRYSGFNNGGLCAPSTFIVSKLINNENIVKCISLVGKACSNNGGEGWWGITQEGTSASRAPSAIINNVAVACKPSGGLEYSTNLIDEMFSSSPRGAAITWANITGFSDFKFTGLAISEPFPGFNYICAKANGLVIMSTDGINWNELFRYDPDSNDVGRENVFFTNDGRLIVPTENAIWCTSNNILYDNMEMTECSISGSDWRTPTSIDLHEFTVYVTTRVSSYGLAVSIDGVTWINLSSINFSDTSVQGIIGNPVFYDGNIYFPTFDGINYIRSISVSEFAEMIPLDRIIDEHINFIPEGSGAVLNTEDLYSKINEIISVVNAIRKIVKA